ncbi:heavy-metal-associated domain-containing protein [Nakamurella flavida]|uniref:Heavy-metal-associated domain-containing protein n=1 Tax=Nakamurella flavida TaxID=363630 RepID=A0A938YPG4_9ACTN|nr:heavy-metal-associated domain-containing protein [Nakamurella flavida]MBM9476575.1 heavy-metal-associated domain-containing protein [Nakamurella flavida]MDP9778987.1 copper chaperone CopZ [Nakamurella flavida]
MAQNESVHEYRVVGMTCAHCVASVTEEVTELAGGQSVSVDLAGGLLTVVGASVTEDQVRGAVEEAGYHLAG